MACKIKKLLLKGIFILFCAVFVMSHNTQALTLTQNVRLVGVYSAGLTAYGSLISVTNAASVYGGNSGVWVEDFYITFRNLACTPGDLLQVNINLFNVNNDNALNAWVSSLYGGDSDFSFIETEYQNLDQNTGQIKITLSCTNNFSRPLSQIRLDSATGSRFALNANEYMTILYASRYRIVDPSVDAHEAAENLYEINQKVDNIVSKLGNNAEALNNVNNNIESVNDTLQQQKEEEQNALNDATTGAQDGADDSSEEATTATSSLISAITGFVSAITSASPSNCFINGNMGNINMGMIDLCANPVPSYISVIGSIIVVMLVIPFCIIMFNRFIGLFRSFQN